MMNKKIILADKSGFCFGVKRAVDITVDQKKSADAKLYTLGPLIHNNDVIHRLKEKGIDQIDEDDLETLEPKDTIIIRSHGVTLNVIGNIEKSGSKMVNATCPFVTKIQKIAEKYHDLGYQIIIVGDENHPEVVGINGWCNNSAIITKDGSNLSDLPAKVCVVAQTTERLFNFEKVVDIVSKKCEEVLTFNTICSATKERQESADEVSKQVDLMIVIGGKHSSNSKKLFDICRTNCENTIFIEKSLELPTEAFDTEDVKTIGITAGASTPDWIIQDVIEKIK